MKKTLLLSGALFAATLAAAVTTNTTSAADGQGDTSSADFTINPTTDDKNNTLWLSAEPSFSFGAADLKDIVSSAQTLPDDTKDVNNAKTLTVNDYTGDSKGWYVTAKLSDFTTEGNTDTITANGLNYTQSLNTDLTDPTDPTSPKNTTNFDPTGTGSILLNTVSLKGTPSTVLAAGDKYGQGVTSTTATNATLDLPEHASAKAAAYTANITWTLTQGQPAESGDGAGNPS